MSDRVGSEQRFKNLGQPRNWNKNPWQSLGLPRRSQSMANPSGAANILCNNSAIKGDTPRIPQEPSAALEESLKPPGDRHIQES